MYLSVNIHMDTIMMMSGFKKNKSSKSFNLNLNSLCTVVHAKIVMCFANISNFVVNLV